MTLRVPYTSDSFPPGTLDPADGTLEITWDDILWAAVTVGRPNRNFVFQHGAASIYEALFRWSLVRMALEEPSPADGTLRATAAFKTLDPTEKGAVSYFLGMTFCKLFASKLLDTPWLLHLDVYRPQLDAVLAGRSRPDLVGRSASTNKWSAFECKGRVRPPGDEVKQKAKHQATRVLSVDSQPCALHVGAVTYLRTWLEFYWRDPAPGPGSRIDVPYQPGDWKHYYAPVVTLLRSVDTPIESDSGTALGEPGVTHYAREADVTVEVHPEIAPLLAQGSWDAARETANRLSEKLADTAYQPDGLTVKAGRTWSHSAGSGSEARADA